MRKLLINLVALGVSINAHAALDSSQTTNNNVLQSIDSVFSNQWIADKLSIHAHTDHYAWSGNNNTSGWQNVTPITVNYRAGNFLAGVRTAYIFSENSSPNSRGYVDTLSDTNVSLSYSQALATDWNLRFNLDWNAPTGTSALNAFERNAIMDANLIQQTRFGMGHNVTPGLVLTKAFGDKAAVAVGVSHTIYGSFNTASDLANARYKPGDETRVTLQGQYSGENWLVLGGMIYTNSQNTQFNHQDYFRKGDRFDVNLAAVYSLPYQQRLTGSFRYGTQAPDLYLSQVAGTAQTQSRNINGDNFYLSLEYAKTFYDKHVFKLLGDWMMVDKNSFDQVNNLYYAGREKWQIGLGYDYLWDAKKRLYFIAKNMQLDVQGTPVIPSGTQYNGWTISAGFDWQF